MWTRLQCGQLGSADAIAADAKPPRPSRTFCDHCMPSLELPPDNVEATQSCSANESATTLTDDSVGGQ